MTILFFGTSSFAVPILEALCRDARFDVIGVVTQPDRPTGRRATNAAGPIKLKAERRGIPVWQFDSVKSEEAFLRLRDAHADAAVVASFGQIIPQRVLDLFPRGMINVHASLLPTYRGASPIAAALLHGDAETGVSIMKMDAHMDRGHVLEQAREVIRADDTAARLSERLAELGAHILPDVLDRYLAGHITPAPQDESGVSIAPLLKREDGLIDWSASSFEIERKIRAYDPWPGTFMPIDGTRLKILKAAIGHPAKDAEPGRRIVQEKLPAVVCGDRTALLLTLLQPEGKRSMSGQDFLRGHAAWISPRIG